MYLAVLINIYRTCMEVGLRGGGGGKYEIVRAKLTPKHVMSYL
jgi:hypothetical protein